MTLVAIGEGLAEVAVSDDASSPQLNCGGDAANVCVMASRLGAPTRLIGRVGADALGRRLTGFWQEEGIDLGGITVDEGSPTGLYINEPDALDGHRFIYWRRGSAGSRLSPADVHERFLRDASFFVFTGISAAISSTAHDAVWQGISLARASSVRVACVLNHRAALGGDREALRALVSHSDVLIASREEIAIVFPDEDLPSSIIETAITDGARGATASCDEGLVHQPAPPVSVRNAAGAGDAFAGAYLSRRAAGSVPKEALRDAVAVASLSVQSDGCALSFPSGVDAEAAIERMPPQTAKPEPALS